jgi:hypothetical protein
MVTSKPAPLDPVYTFQGDMDLRQGLESAKKYACFMDGKPD